jgi:hypothetical protein
MRILSAQFVVACAFFLARSVFAQSSLYTVSSKAQGAAFDLVVTETRREPSKSFLSVPGFHERTAPGSRWLMCAYTDLAVKRGFSHWVVIYPPENSEVLVLGFSNSPRTSVKDLLGEDFSKERAFGDGEFVIPVERFFPMCGMRRQEPVGRDGSKRKKWETREVFLGDRRE